MTSLKILQPQLSDKGFVKTYYPLPIEVVQAVYEKEWQSLDRYFQKQILPNGNLFQLLARYGTFQSIESILAIRKAPDDDDGIWHDDGSRHMAFSLGLNLRPDSIVGGDLYLRQKGTKFHHSITSPRAGELYIFLTGSHGYEHKVTKVTEGERIVCAGWCT